MLQEKIINILKEKIEKEYSEDIDLMVVYGSYVTGHNTEVSDVDFFFVPRRDRAYEMMTTFIINDIGYDFWPISWDRLKGFSEFDEPFVSILGEGEVVYYRDESCKKKHDDLIRNMLKRMTQSDNGHLLYQASKILKDIKGKYFDLNEDKENLKKNALNILSDCLNIIAYLNRKYVLKGVERLEYELSRFDNVPEGFEDLFEKVISLEGDEVISLIHKTILEFDRMIEGSKVKHEFSNEKLKGCYEELKSTYNKVHYGITSGNRHKSMYASLAIDAETKYFLGQHERYNEFSELFDFIEDDQALIEACRRHEALWLQILEEENVFINDFDSIEKFNEYIRNK